MKTLFIVLMLFSVSCIAQEKPTAKQDMAIKLGPDYAEYVKVCFNDSTLNVYWTYTGNEKPEAKMDTTMVKGKSVRVITVVPTQQFKVTRVEPTWAGFEAYLKKKETLILKK